MQQIALSDCRFSPLKSSVGLWAALAEDHVWVCLFRGLLSCLSQQERGNLLELPALAEERGQVVGAALETPPQH